MTALGGQMFLIDVIIVGGEYGILTRADRVLDRTVPTAAAQASQNTVTFTAVVMIRMGGVERPLNCAPIGEEQAGENDTDQHFGDGLHCIIRYRY